MFAKLTKDEFDLSINRRSSPMLEALKALKIEEGLKYAGTKEEVKKMQHVVQTMKRSIMRREDVRIVTRLKKEENGSYALHIYKLPSDD